MTRREKIVSELGLNKIVQESIKRHPRFADKRVGFIDGAEWMQKTMIEKACRCYCDDICDKGRCCMCFHKHDGKGQVKNVFRYNECNELKLIRKAMEE